LALSRGDTVGYARNYLIVFTEISGPR